MRAARNPPPGLPNMVFRQFLTKKAGAIAPKMFVRATRERRKAAPDVAAETPALPASGYRTRSK